MMRGRYSGWSNRTQQPKRSDGTLSRYILRPIVTEKSSLVSGQDQIVLQVPMYVTKNMLQQAVSALFGAKVVRVNMLRRRGKTKIFKGRRYQRSDTKRAYVSLEKGKGVDFFKKGGGA